MKMYNSEGFLIELLGFYFQIISTEKQNGYNNISYPPSDQVTPVKGI